MSDDTTCGGSTDATNSTASDTETSACGAQTDGVHPDRREAEFTASVEDPHALYFGGWFFYLGILLIVAGIEYGLRRLDVYHRFSSGA